MPLEVKSAWPRTRSGQRVALAAGLVGAERGAVDQDAIVHEVGDVEVAVGIDIGVVEHPLLGEVRVRGHAHQAERVAARLGELAEVAVAVGGTGELVGLAEDEVGLLRGRYSGSRGCGCCPHRRRRWGWASSSDRRPRRRRGRARAVHPARRAVAPARLAEQFQDVDFFAVEIDGVAGRLGGTCRSEWRDNVNTAISVAVQTCQRPISCLARGCCIHQSAEGGT